MGLAASQCRLLNLTSRLSDLELRAQTISNSKIRLSMDSEAASTEYSDALNKEKLSLLTGYTNGTATYADLDYDNLTGVKSPLLSQYGLSNSKGQLLVTKEQAANFEKSANLSEFLKNCGVSSNSITTYANGGTEAQYKAAVELKNTKEAEYTGTNGAKATTAADKKLLDDYGALYVEGYDKVNGGGAWESKVLNASDDKGVETSDDLKKAADAVSKAAQAAVPKVKLAGNSDAIKAMGELSKAATTSATTPTVTTVNATASAAKAAYQACSDYAESLEESGMPTFNEERAQIPYQEPNDEGNGQQVDWQPKPKAPVKNPTNPAFLTKMKNANAATDAVYSVMDLANKAAEIADKLTPSDSKDPSWTYYNSVKNPEKISFVNPGDKTEDEMKAITTQYNIYLKNYNDDVNVKEPAAKTAYDNAVTELNKFGTPNTTSTIGNSPEATYYRNLYDRMTPANGGYFTTEDKDGNDDATQIKSKDWVQSQIMNGNLVLEKVGKDGKWASDSYGSDSNIIESTDKTDQAKAEAKYNMTMAQIQTKDKRFDLDLKNIDTEHSAVQTEVDSVHKIIDKNIERNFKMFQA